jgi:hypothetical protein
MTKTDAIGADVQGSFAAALAAALQKAEGGSAEAVLAALKAELGGERRGVAVLAGLDELVAYGRAPLPADSVLDEEHLAQKVAHPTAARNVPVAVVGSVPQ